MGSVEPRAGDIRRRQRGHRISVGIPVWNGERYLGAAIESILGQTYTELELVICDNASTDETEAICRAYGRADARIRYFRNSTNLGAAPNFNRCFELARSSEYFKWHAHDDLVSPDYVARCIELLDYEEDVVLAFGRTTYIDADGAEIAQAASDVSVTGDLPSVRVRQLVRHALSGPDVYWSIYGVARSEMIATTQLHGGYIASDQVLLLEMALRGKLAQVDGPSLRSRKHPSAWTFAARDPRQDVLWFDASRRPRVVLPYCTLMAHHYRAIWRGTSSPVERLKCMGLVSERPIREWRTLGGDIKQALGSRRRSHCG